MHNCVFVWFCQIRTFVLIRIVINVQSHSTLSYTWPLVSLIGQKCYLWDTSNSITTEYLLNDCDTSNVCCISSCWQLKIKYIPMRYTLFVCVYLKGLCLLNIVLWINCQTVRKYLLILFSFLFILSCFQNRKIITNNQCSYR